MRTFVALATALLWACGGREQPGPAPAPTPVYTASAPPVPATNAFCPPAGVSPDAGGADCIVVRATLPAGDDEACCEDPGLAPLPASLPPSSISQALSGYGCVCLVKPSGVCAAPALPASPFAWCSADRVDSNRLGCPNGAIVVGPSVAEGAEIVLACYAVGTLLP